MSLTPLRLFIFINILLIPVPSVFVIISVILLALSCIIMAFHCLATIERSVTVLKAERTPVIKPALSPK